MKENKFVANWNVDDLREHGASCNDCYLSMQNCHDMSICCEDETGLCDWFEPTSEFGHKHSDYINRFDAIQDKNGLILKKMP